MAKAKRETESFSMSYLDVMCCGFGAIILLLMITKTTVDQRREITPTVSSGSILELQKQLFEIRGETNIYNRELNAKHEQLSQFEERVARLRLELSELTNRFESTNDSATEYEEMQGELELARQSLTEEMKRLQAQQSTAIDTESIGGIPVDSEYVIFIIDTSGSMFNYAWDKMMEVVADTLRIYPEVKGIQVMSDQGEYMFSTFRGTWIPDTPARRTAIMQRLRSWNPFSVSSPVRGIITAIQTFYDPDKKISLYVLGDDFTGESISDVVDTVDRINAADETGERRVRIHGIGFPVILSQPARYQTGGYRFSALMRELARKNGGTFVALNDFY
jgi:hypothetical protein